jgi:DNA mismatch endonuclease, patch repair protein
MMSGIRGKDTRPELIVRKGLHATGFRYRLHVKELPGKPDLVLPKYGAVIFVHGCFWHGHDCSLFKWPSSRPEWWKAKILRNRTNDAEATKALLSRGWRVLEIWECALKGRFRYPADQVVIFAAEWLHEGSDLLTVKEIQHG